MLWPIPPVGLLFARLVVATSLVVPLPVVPALAETPRADPALDRLIAATEDAFPRVPRVRLVAETAALCGGEVAARAIYCTTDNTIYLTEGAGPAALYALAHLYGHGLQVRYGVADLALNAILSRPERETELRAMVTAQVECLAGFLISRAGLSLPPIDTLFSEEPMTDAHWGRSPVRAGPRVTIGLPARADWLTRGAEARSAAACRVGEMTADPIAAADQG